jgi:hypothetical protein
VNTNPTGIASWTNSKLDTGALQISLPVASGNTEVYLPVGQVDGGKNYVLRFSVQGTKDTALHVRLVGRIALTEVKTFKVNARRREYEFLFQQPIADANARILIQTKATNMQYWVDNVSLREADITLLDPADYIRFEWNPTNADKTILLDPSATYVDVKGNSFNHSITLEPFTSVILLQTNTPSVLSKPMPSISLISPDVDTSFTSPATVALIAKTTNVNSNIVKVEFFSGSNLIGTTNTAPYVFTWLNADAGTYSITAKATDNEGVTLTSSPIVLDFVNINTCVATGSILREYWSNVAGTSVSAVPVNTPPSSMTPLTSFEVPSNAGDNYGQRIRGYICAPISGQYTFYIASDDNSELWLSTSDNPASKVRIASVVGWTGKREWTKFASQKSVSITLLAGVRYYIEALHKEGSGGDHLAVGWIIPGSSAISVIPGSVLSPFVASNQLTSLVALSKEQDLLEDTAAVQKLSIAVYPNPSGSSFTLTMQSRGADPILLNIFDFSGKIVERRTANATNSTIPFGQNLPRGTYILQIIQGEQKAEMKITKL